MHACTREWMPRHTYTECTHGTQMYTEVQISVRHPCVRTRTHSHVHRPQVTQDGLPARPICSRLHAPSLPAGSSARKQAQQATCGLPVSVPDDLVLPPPDITWHVVNIWCLSHSSQCKPLVNGLLSLSHRCVPTHGWIINVCLHDLEQVWTLGT